MPAKTISAGDFTGRQRAKLERERAQEKAARKDSISMITGAQEAAKDDVVDYRSQKQGRKRGRPEAAKAPVTDTATGEEIEDPTIAAIVGEGYEEPDPDALDDVDYTDGVETPVYPDVEIKAMADLEQVTIGVGTEYNFEYGRKYIVPYNVAFHLQEQGYCEVLRAVR